jgi:hypothetical protein
MDRNDSGIPHNLTADDLANLRTYIAADNPSDAWRYLAEHGDAYGVLASDIVKDEPETLVGKAFHGMVGIHWGNTGEESSA